MQEEQRQLEAEMEVLRKHYGKRLFQAPLTAEELRGLLTGAGRNVTPLTLLYGRLSEDAFIRRDEDVALFSHLAILPPVWHSHDFFEISCVKSGVFQNFYGGQRFVTTQGNLLIVSPGTEHAVCTEQSDAQMTNILVRRSTFREHFFGILPEDDILHTFFARALDGREPSQVLLFSAGQDPQLFRILSYLEKECSGHMRYREAMIRSLLVSFFAFLLRNHEMDVSSPGARTSYVSRDTVFLLEYMKHNFRNLSLSSLAGFFHYSERQTERILLGATGMGFVDNLREIRISEAEKLLLNTDLSVAEIAEQTGFCDASHLRKAFRRQTGMTPSAFRSSH